MESLKNKIQSLISPLLEQGVIVFPSIIIIKIFDLFIFEFFSFPSHLEKLQLFGIIIFKELIFVIFYLLTIGLILSLVKLFSRYTYWILVTIFSLALLFVYLTTSQYFHTAHLLLDHVILFFTFDELLEIAGTETGRLQHEYLWYYSIPILVFIGTLLSNKQLVSKIIPSKKIKMIFSILLILIGVNFMTKNAQLSEQESKIATSKPKYLISKIYHHIRNQKSLKDVTDSELNQSIDSFRSFMKWPKSVHQYDYPFARHFNLEDNTLKPYFEEFKKPPNIVLVFCEGLSSTFSGVSPVLKSFTPYLDSLYAQSLYWPHTLSNTDRTHGVFANTLASLPPGYERGMLNLKTEFPQHLSILKLLISNGYGSSFTYGGWGYFDNIEPFLRKNYVKDIHDKTFINKNDIYQLHPKNNDFTWGIHDKKMFDLYFNFKDTSNATPYVDVIITLSLHSPFDIPEQEKYLKIAKKMLTKNEEEKKFYDNYKESIAAILYQDQAISDFMKEYRKKTEYENTVFVFVGDHNVNTLPLRSELDSHYVPLAIFSPKLKSPKQFNDIVAHTDIPHGLLTLTAQFMIKNKLPIHTNWVGSGLSTQNKVNAIQPKFINRFNGDIFGVINYDTLYMNDKMYKVRNQLELKEIEIGKRIEFYKNQLQNYKYMNNYTVDSLKLLLPIDTTNFMNEDADSYFPEYNKDSD